MIINAYNSFDNRYGFFVSNGKCDRSSNHMIASEVTLKN